MNGEGEEVQWEWVSEREGREGGYETNNLLCSFPLSLQMEVDAVEKRHRTRSKGVRGAVKNSLSRHGPGARPHRHTQTHADTHTQKHTYTQEHTHTHIHVHAHRHTRHTHTLDSHNYQPPVRIEYYKNISETPCCYQKIPESCCLPVILNDSTFRIFSVHTAYQKCSPSSLSSSCGASRSGAVQVGVSYYLPLFPVFKTSLYYFAITVML